MQIFKTQKQLTRYLKEIRKNKTIGFIPTMGALHSGHISLIHLSKKKCDITVCSIFINPTQFNNSKDFQKYPKNHTQDIPLLQKNECDILYIPDVKDLYIKSEQTKKFDFGELTKAMEAEYRPGHFNGVGTIVEKLLNIINPHKAFFGQKDLQQLYFVKALANTLSIKVDIIACKTIREKNGLAKSSRNTLLSENQKYKAGIIYQCLNFCKKNQQLGVSALKKHTIQKINSIKDIKIEYIEFINLENFKKITVLDEKNENAICIAAYLNEVRLIDNIIL